MHRGARGVCGTSNGVSADAQRIVLSVELQACHARRSGSGLRSRCGGAIHWSVHCLAGSRRLLSLRRCRAWLLSRGAWLGRCHRACHGAILCLTRRWHRRFLCGGSRSGLRSVSEGHTHLHTALRVGALNYFYCLVLRVLNIEYCSAIGALYSFNLHSVNHLKCRLGAMSMGLPLLGQAYTHAL